VRFLAFFTCDRDTPLTVAKSETRAAGGRQG
jgi:hypothetical protein